MIQGIYHGPTDEIMETFIDGNTYDVAFMFTDIPYYAVIDGEGDRVLMDKNSITLVNATDEDLDWYITDQTTLERVLVHKGKNSNN